jgi:hypothetical protein
MAFVPIFARGAGVVQAGLSAALARSIARKMSDVFKSADFSA